MKHRVAPSFGVVTCARAARIFDDHAGSKPMQRHSRSRCLRGEVRPPDAQLAIRYEIAM
jgi:hypothetical protein